MIELKFEGLNKVSNINEIIKSSEQDAERASVYRTKCSIPKHRQIFNIDGDKISGVVDVEIIKSKGTCMYLNIRKNKDTSIGFEIDKGVIKLR